MTKDKRASLTKYAESLKHKLSSPVPLKHKSREQAFRQMLEFDLKKTLLRLQEE